MCLVGLTHNVVGCRQRHWLLAIPDCRVHYNPPSDQIYLPDSPRTMSGCSKSPINLLRGWPNASLLPAAQLKAASSIALSDPSIYIPGLEYGPDPGYEPLRHQIAQWLSRFYRTSQPLDSARICITGGASQNLACLLQGYSDPLYTRNVWMVSPTYFLACRIFEDSGFQGRLRSLPEDEEGVDVDFLEQELRKSERKARAEGNTKPVWEARNFGSIHLLQAN